MMFFVCEARFYAPNRPSEKDEKEFDRQFDKAMVTLAREKGLLATPPVCLRCDEEKKILILRRAGLVFVFNFNPEQSFERYGFAVEGGRYRVVLDSDAGVFGGFSRNDDGLEHDTVAEGEADNLYLYVPSRTVQVLEKI